MKECKDVCFLTCSLLDCTPFARIPHSNSSFQIGDESERNWRLSTKQLNAFCSHNQVIPAFRVSFSQVGFFCQLFPWLFCGSTYLAFKRKGVDFHRFLSFAIVAYLLLFRSSSNLFCLFYRVTELLLNVFIYNRQYTFPHKLHFGVSSERIFFSFMFGDVVDFLLLSRVLFYLNKL